VLKIFYDGKAKYVVGKGKEIHILKNDNTSRNGTTSGDTTTP
jgi:hypothetical protein